MLKNSILILLSFLSIHLFAQKDTTQTETEFKFGGYVKADYIYTQYNNGDVAPESPLRDIHLPSQIPVGEQDVNYDGDFHVKESRFNFDVRTDKFNKPIHGFIELDFLLSKAGDEKVSNSFNPRLRHFYAEWDRFLFGQTWSNFMILAIPLDLDFAGAAEGIVFIRQPQIRYKGNGWSVSLENPETTTNRYGESTSPTETGIIPDITARKDFKGTWGTWSITGIARSLNDEDSLAINHSAFGWGVSTGGIVKLGQNGDDVRITATYGSGLGRYIALGFVSAGITTNNGITPINTFNGHIAYNHLWSNVFSSSLGISSLNAMYPDSYSGLGSNNKNALSTSINFKYHPVKEILIGLEYMYAYRQTFDNTDGYMNRVQLSLKYTFGYTNKEISEKTR